jgi:hypothetical protein
MNVKIFGREPAAIIAAIQSVLALLIGFGALSFIGLSTQTDLGVVMAVVNGLSALYLAYVTSETLLAPVVEVIKASLALGAIYGLHINAEQTALLIASATAVIGAWHRERTSPLVHPTFSYIAPTDEATPKAA